MTIIEVISSSIKDKIRNIKFLGFGKSDVQEHSQVSPFGDDSNPIEGMSAIYSETSEIGKTVIIGYFNENAISEPGEKRIFSLDADGVISMFLHLKNDGTAEFGGDADFLVRFGPLQDEISQLKSDFNKLTNAFNTHTHATAAVGPPVPPTPVPNVVPASVSTIDISDAKIDELKCL